MEVHVFRCRCNCKCWCWRLTGCVRHNAEGAFDEKSALPAPDQQYCGLWRDWLLMALPFGGVAVQKLASQ